jgi:N-acyl homoserine lactone hydrolase
VSELVAVGPLRVAGRPRRLVPLVLGYETIAEAVSLSDGSRFRYLLEPVTAAAVEFDRGWVLLDGGFDPTRIHDRDRRVAAFDYENYAPVVPTADPLVEQIAEAGLAWDDLAAAAISHAHFDHTGAARMLTPAQPLVMQRREWEHATTLADPRGAFVFPDEFAREGLRIALLDGDTELAPGLVAIDTRGHTPGHQSFVVELPKQTVVLACDAADLRANLELDRPCGSTVGPDGPADAASAVARLRALDALPGHEVWPGHDPAWAPWRTVIDARA